MLEAAHEAYIFIVCRCFVFLVPCSVCCAVCVVLCTLWRVLCKEGSQGNLFNVFQLARTIAYIHGKKMADATWSSHSHTYYGASCSVVKTSPAAHHLSTSPFQ